MTDKDFHFPTLFQSNMSRAQSGDSLRPGRAARQRAFALEHGMHELQGCSCDVKTPFNVFKIEISR